MIDFIVEIPRYFWTIKVVFIVDEEMLQDLAKELQYNRFDPDTISYMYKTLHRNLDTGFTCSDPNRKLSYMIINNASTIGEFLDTFNHEKNHIEMHICETYGINPYSEEAAYLSGKLAKSIYLGIVNSLR